MATLALQVPALSRIELLDITLCSAVGLFHMCCFCYKQTDTTFVAASPLFSLQQGEFVHSNDEDLKRLGFVQSYSGFCFNKSYSLASSVYNTSLAYTPARLNSSVRAVEGVITEYTVPVVSAVQSSSWRALYQLDHQVWLPDNSLALGSQLC